MNKLMIAAALCVGTLCAQAQTTPSKVDPNEGAQKSVHAQHNCMMATDKDWASLGLSAEQTTKVKVIQGECQTDCGAMTKDDPKMGMMMDKHEARVKEVMTAAQYDKWMTWCANQAKMVKDAVPSPNEKM